MNRARLAAAALLALSPSAVAQEPQAKDVQMTTVEQRLQETEDKLAIERLINDYAVALDARDVEGYVALFAKDAEWVNGAMVRKGADEIRALVVGLWVTNPTGPASRKGVELVSNPEINLDGDRATARSRHLLLRPDENGAPQAVLAGQYDDQLIREDGEWKFLRRVDNPVMPTAAEWGEIMRKRRVEQAQKAK
jgi:uncharacterized protein (TIGR02246 family)